MLCTPEIRVDHSNYSRGVITCRAICVDLCSVLTSISNPAQPQAVKGIPHAPNTVNPPTLPYFTYLPTYMYKYIRSACPWASKMSK